MPGGSYCRGCGGRINGHPPRPGDVEPVLDARGFFRHPDCPEAPEPGQAQPALPRQPLLL